MKSSARPRWALSMREATRGPAPFPYRLLVGLLHPLIGLLTRRHWWGGQHIPQEGPVLIVSNHTSNYDTLAVGEYLIFHGRWPRYLGKADIWRVPVVRWFAKGCRQIPVLRNTPQAKDSLVHAEQALQAGDMVAMYPEGTITRDPELWPMTGRRGAVRLALATGVPVIPVVQWGSHHVLGSVRLAFPKPWRGKADVYVVAGPPIDLSAFPSGRDISGAVADEAAEVIMAKLTDMLAEIRQEKAPNGRFDMRVGTRVDSTGQ